MKKLIEATEEMTKVKSSVDGLKTTLGDVKTSFERSVKAFGTFTKTLDSLKRIEELVKNLDTKAIVKDMKAAAKVCESWGGINGLKDAVKTVDAALTDDADGLEESLEALNETLGRGVARDAVKEIHDYNVTISKLGGHAHEALCDYTADDFADGCCDALKRTRLMRMRRAKDLVYTIQDARRRVESKYVKLASRIDRGDDGVPEELSTARKLTERLKETMAILDRRIEIVAEFFYDERRRVLSEIRDLTAAVTGSGATVLRGPAMKYRIKDIVDGISSLDGKAERTMK